MLSQAEQFEIGDNYFFTSYTDHLLHIFNQPTLNKAYISSEVIQKGGLEGPLSHTPTFVALIPEGNHMFPLPDPRVKGVVAE